MSTPSPVTDGTHVWVMTGTGILKAFDFSGTELWSRDIQKDYGRFGLNWGYGSSPLLHGDALYVQVLHGMRTDDPSYLLRIDKATGRTRLARRAADAGAIRSRRTRTPRRRCCATAPATEIVVTGGDVVTGHDPATGQGAVAGQRPQSRQRRQLPDRRLAGGSRRHDLRAVARAADAGAESRRPRRRDASRTCCGRSTTARTCRRRSPTAPISTSSTTAASCSASTRRPARKIYGRQRLRPGDLQRVAGARRREDLHHERRRRDRA